MHRIPLKLMTIKWISYLYALCLCARAIPKKKKKKKTRTNKAKLTKNHKLLLYMTPNCGFVYLEPKYPLLVWLAHLFNIWNLQYTSTQASILSFSSRLSVSTFKANNKDNKQHKIYIKSNWMYLWDKEVLLRVSNDILFTLFAYRNEGIAYGKSNTEAIDDASTSTDLIENPL